LGKKKLGMNLSARSKVGQDGYGVEDKAVPGRLAIGSYGGLHSAFGCCTWYCVSGDIRGGVRTVKIPILVFSDRRFWIVVENMK